MTSLASTNIIPVWFDSSNHLHRDVQYHPENPQRITACVKALSQESCVKLLDIAEQPTALVDDATTIHSEPLSAAALDRAREMLRQTHVPELVSKLQETCQTALQGRINAGKDPLGHVGYLDPDTYVTTETWHVVQRAAAAWMRAVEVAIGSSDNDNDNNDKQSPPTLALVRPPGHHATHDTSNGFCLVNFAAAAARHALTYPRVQRVSILDWDVHYGQGVADIVQGNPNIRYVSIHQVPAFPYMGQVKQVTHHNVLTLPMPPDTTWTCGYQDLWNTALDFVVDDDWKPDLVIVCAGFDALSSDELASCSLTAADFGRMTRALRQRLEPQHTPLMLGLEGGYQLQDVGPTGNLPQAVVETVRALAE